jgi:hypothetical protein
LTEVKIGSKRESSCGGCCSSSCCRCVCEGTLSGANSSSSNCLSKSRKSVNSVKNQCIKILLEQRHARRLLFAGTK